MTYYFNLQYRRICRLLIHFGVYPWFGFLLATIAFTVIAGLLFSRSAYAGAILVGLLASWLWPLSERDRNQFLKGLYPMHYYKIRLIENGLILTPIVFVLLITREFTSLFCAVVLALFFAIYRNANPLNRVIPTPFKKDPFEFIVGFRKYIPVIVGLYILSGIGCIVHNYNLAVVCMAMIHIVCMQFYNLTEPVTYLKMYTLSPKQYIFQKSKVAIQHGVMVSLLFCMVTMLVFPDNWFLTLAIWMYSLMFIILSLYLKYASYPNFPRLLDMIFVGAGIFFPPILILLLFYYFRRSVHNLSLYIS